MLDPTEHVANIGQRSGHSSCGALVQLAPGSSSEPPAPVMLLPPEPPVALPPEPPPPPVPPVAVRLPPVPPLPDCAALGSATLALVRKAMPAIPWSAALEEKSCRWRRAWRIGADKASLLTPLFRMRKAGAGLPTGTR